MTGHAWVQSRLGHGESYCTQCHATNREIAVIGDMNVCTKAPSPEPPTDTKLDLDGMELGFDIVAQAICEVFWRLSSWEKVPADKVQVLGDAFNLLPALLAEHKATKERMDLAEFLLAIMTATSQNFFFSMHQNTLSLCNNADIAWDRTFAAERLKRDAEAELSATKERLADLADRFDALDELQGDTFLKLSSAEAQLARAKEAIGGLLDKSTALVVKAIRNPEDADGLERWTAAVEVARDTLKALEQG